MKRFFFLLALSVVFSISYAAEESPLILFTAISGKPSQNEAREIVRLSQAAGFNQWVVYPRSGLELEYMGEEWLAFMGEFLAAAKARGGHVWLYDEYNWPSGSCKGRVPMENPEWTYTEIAVRGNPDGSFAWEIKRNDQLSMYDKYFDVNAYSTEAIRRFIELTHEVYERRFGPYFRDGTIKGIFTDEPGHPSVMKWRNPQPIVAFRWWEELESQYQSQTGRSFRSDVEAALRDPRQTAVWETYTELKGRQFRRAFFDPIAAWCRKMGVELCGHMIAEGNPEASCNYNGLPLNTICGLTLPGMDKIGAEMTPDSEWLTYATALYGIEHNSQPGETLTTHGGIELYALGPMDLTLTQLAQRLWLSALYGMDTYYLSLYHLTGKGFLEKGGYGMFTSPTQPYFDKMADLHDEARLAAHWSRKRFRREVAIRYPQRQSGRLALGRMAPDERKPPFLSLVNACSWGQVSFELLQEDERSDCQFVFNFKDGRIIEERTGREFVKVSDVVAWLHAECTDAWRVLDKDGHVVPGLLVRQYVDGTGLVLNLTGNELTDLRLTRGDVFDLPACGKAIFDSSATNWRRTEMIAPIAAQWEVSLDRNNLRRIWFGSNDVARLSVKTGVRNARWLVCNYPEGSVRVTLNGRTVCAPQATSAPPYGYAGLYRMSEPVDLPSGEYELRLAGRHDDSVFLPVLWLEGDFAANEPSTLVAVPRRMTGFGSLAAMGLGDYVGTIVFSTEVKVEGPLLHLETGGLVTRVKLGGHDLGLKGVGPFEWRVPRDLLGRSVRLEIALTTSVRPAFGRAPSFRGSPTLVPGVLLKDRLWCPTIWNGGQEGLLFADWRKLIE